MIIKSGDIFAFYIEQNRKYGIVQVLGKNNNTGYNVRVFYFLIDNIENNVIDAMVQTTDFYYILGFFSFDLMAGKHIGRFAIPDFVTVPEYTRKCERKQSGALFWYVTGDPRVVKTYKRFEETLKTLSPADAWGIQYIKKCWIDGFTLENWHELEEKWYTDYLKIYEPDKFLKKKKTPPFEQWAKHGRISQKSLQEIALLFKTFIRQISTQKDDKQAINISIKQLIDGLNAWNLQYNFIETEECEELVDYIDFILQTYHCVDTDDCIDTYRQW